MKLKCKFLELFIICLLLFTGVKLFTVEHSSKKTECVVLLTNRNYFNKFLKTLNQLTTKGNYHGDICLVIGDDLLKSPFLNNSLIIQNNVVVKHFPDFKFNKKFLEIAKKSPIFEKLFQYHKFYLFDTYFKQWETILYLDCGMEIYSDIRPILDLKRSNRLLAHSDSYPSYVRKLSCQFKNKPYDCKKRLSKNFNLNIDYFQTTMMLYDTSIIKKNIIQDFYELALRYPISKTHEQGIMALYFTNIMPVWEPLPIKNETTYFYDFMKRNRNGPFIMIKYPNI